MTPDERAKQVLFEHINEREQRRYTTHGTIRAIGNLGTVFYICSKEAMAKFGVGRVQSAQHGPICIDFPYVPDAEGMLALKLWAEADEREMADAV